MNNGNAALVWIKPFQLIMILLAILVLGTFILMCIRLATEISIKGENFIYSGIPESAMEERLNNLEKSMVETKTQITRMCDNTVSMARDLISMLAFLVALLSLVATYIIKSIEPRLRKEADQAVSEVIDEQRTVIQMSLDSLMEARTSLDRLWSEDLGIIKTGADYIFANYQRFIESPSVLAGFRKALSSSDKESNNELSSFLLRILVLLGDNEATKELIERFKNELITTEDRKLYKAALRTFVEEHENEKVKKQLEEAGLLDKIMAD